MCYSNLKSSYKYYYNTSALLVTTLCNKIENQNSTATVQTMHLWHLHLNLRYDLNRTTPIVRFKIVYNFMLLCYQTKYTENDISPRIGFNVQNNCDRELFSREKKTKYEKISNIFFWSDFLFRDGPSSVYIYKNRNNEIYLLYFLHHKLS